MAVIAAYIVPHPPIIVPEVGKGEEIKIHDTSEALNQISKEIADLAPDTIVLVSPHSTAYWDYFHISPGEQGQGNLKSFGVHDVNLDVNYDTEFVETLAKLASEHGISAGTDGENEPTLDHGVVVPLYFINKFYIDYHLVRIGLSGMDRVAHYEFGKAIAETAKKLNRKVVFIASGDLSHKLKTGGPYGFASEGPEFDNDLVQCISSGDLLGLMKLDDRVCEAAAQCGLNSFIIMAGALDGKAVKSNLLSYEGPFGVGYAVASLIPTVDDTSRHFDTIIRQEQKKEEEKLKADEDKGIDSHDFENPYVDLARYVIEGYVKSKKVPPLPTNLPLEMLERRAGTFVTCKKRGKLRGCIGTIFPTANCLAEEIVRNAVASVSQDPRFSPVTEGELAQLTYSVDVLGAPEVAKISELDAQKYGVIVTQDSKRGLLLPALDGVDTVNAQVDIAKQKGGITGDDYKLERFEVVRHK